MRVALPLVTSPMFVVLSARLERVAVRVIDAAASATLVAEVVRVTFGAPSSSVMVTVTCWVALSVAPSPPVTFSMSMMIVSPSSSMESSIPVSVLVPLVEPAAITNVALSMEKSVFHVPDPEMPKPIRASVEAELERVPVTVTVPLFSAMLAAEVERVTVGVPPLPPSSPPPP